MSMLEYVQIIFLLVVVAVGVIGFIRALKSDDD